MQIFQIKLFFHKQEKYIEKKFYYSILWAVLNLFENNSQIYESILKISFSLDKEHLYVFISVFWKERFNILLNKLLNLDNKTFSIDNYKFELEQIDFNLKVLDLENISLKTIDKFELKFLSPTQVRNQNKIFTLSSPERFLFSVYQKLKKLGIKFDIDEKDFKKWIGSSVLANKFNIKTELVEIKKSKRAWVVGNISYIVYDKNEQYQKILDLILKVIPYTWIGSGTKLWLGNVKVVN